MPACSICEHPARAELEAGLVSGASVRGLARAHRGVSASALRRHRDAGHLPRAKVDEAEKAEATRAEDLLERAQRYETIAAAVAAEALRGRPRDPKLALQALDRALAAVTAQGRLLPGRQATANAEVRVTFNVPLPDDTGLPPIVDEEDLPEVGSSNGSR